MCSHELQPLQWRAPKHLAKIWTISGPTKAGLWKEFLVPMLPLSLVRMCSAPSARLGSTDTHDEHTRILKRLEQRQITHQNHSNGKNETMKQNAWYKHQE